MKGSTVLKGLTTRLKHFVDGYIFRGKIALYPSLLFTGVFNENSKSP